MFVTLLRLSENLNITSLVTCNFKKAKEDASCMNKQSLTLLYYEQTNTHPDFKRYKIKRGKFITISSKFQLAVLAEKRTRPL